MKHLYESYRAPVLEAIIRDTTDEEAAQRAWLDQRGMGPVDHQALRGVVYDRPSVCLADLLTESWDPIDLEQHYCGYGNVVWHTGHG